LGVKTVLHGWLPNIFAHGSVRPCTFPQKYYY
jgi:hypothetical protein